MKQEMEVQLGNAGDTASLGRPTIVVTVRTTTEHDVGLLRHPLIHSHNVLSNAMVSVSKRMVQHRSTSFVLSESQHTK